MRSSKGTCEYDLDLDLGRIDVLCLRYLELEVQLLYLVKVLEMCTTAAIDLRMKLDLELVLGMQCQTALNYNDKCINKHMHKCKHENRTSTSCLFVCLFIFCLCLVFLVCLFVCLVCLFLFACLPCLCFDRIKGSLETLLNKLIFVAQPNGPETVKTRRTKKTTKT